MAFMRTSPYPDPGLALYGRDLMLRPPLPVDYAAWAELRAASREHLVPWEPQWAADELTRAAYRRRLRQYGDDLAADTGYALFAFRLRDMALLGGVTLSNVRRGVAQAASVGYWMGARHAGRGHMSEMMRAVVPFAFDRLRLHRLEAACLPHNTASIAVLTKSGFRQEGLARGYLKIDGRWQDHLLFGLTETEVAATARQGAR
jgi:ribosomal-protein-alanine N-acetyltransferase